MRESIAAVISAAILVTLPVEAAPTQPAAARSQVALLGTGNPGPSPDNSGPSTAIVVNGGAYLVDFGPGVVRRGSGTAQRGCGARSGEHQARVRDASPFGPHRRYPDLIFTPWTIGRKDPLEVYGPPGIKSMTEHVLAAWAADIEIRSGPVERPIVGDDGYRVNAHEIAPGVEFRDRNVTVTAFTVKHGEWGPRAFGYRFQTPDRTIVLSGDTSPSESVVEQCNGCDVLIHEVYTETGYAKASPEWQRMRREDHTSSRQLGELAARARPGLLVLYHNSYQFNLSKEEDLLREMRVVYRGRFVVGHDLDVY